MEGRRADRQGERVMSGRDDQKLLDAHNGNTSQRSALHTHVRTSRPQRPANNVDGGVCTLPGSQGAETTLHACPRPQIRPIRGNTFHVTRRRWGPWWRPRLHSGWVLIPPKCRRVLPLLSAPVGPVVVAVPLLIFQATACPEIERLHPLPRDVIMLRVRARANGRETLPVRKSTPLLRGRYSGSVARAWHFYIGFRAGCSTTCNIHRDTEYVRPCV